MKGSYFSEGRCLVPRLDWIGAVFSTLLVAVREVLDGTVRSLSPVLGSVREVLGAVLDLMVLFFWCHNFILCCGCIFGCCETVREVLGHPPPEPLPPPCANHGQKSIPPLQKENGILPRPYSLQTGIVLVVLGASLCNAQWGLTFLGERGPAKVKGNTIRSDRISQGKMTSDQIRHEKGETRKIYCERDRDWMRGGKRK